MDNNYVVHSKSLDFKVFKKKLITKSRKSGTYYYATLKNSITTKSKQYYVGKYTINENTLLKYYYKVLFDEMRDILSHLTKKEYQSRYMTKGKMFFLDIIRFSFYYQLKDFTKTDLEKIEESEYTKYVNGTTNVEGNTYTLRETDLTLNKGLTVKGKSKREFFEIDNFAAWKEYLESLSSFNYDKEFIKKIHYFILRNIDDENRGQLRNINVYITGTEFIPTPGILVESELDNLLTWYHENKDKMYPLELIAIFHQRFEEVHPFNDGNGRVGRELIRLQLREFHYPNIFIDNNTREDYLNSLDAGNEGDYTKIVDFLSFLIISGHSKYILKAINLLVELFKLNRKNTDLITFEEAFGKEEWKQFIEKINGSVEAIKSIVEDYEINDFLDQLKKLKI